MNFKRLSIVIVWALISILLFGVSAWAAEIKLKDGTLIEGEIGQDKLKLRTSYAEMGVNVKDIASIVFAEEALETETKAPAIAEEKLPAPVIVEEPQNNKDYRTIAVAFDPLQFILGQASDALILAGNVEYAIRPNISLLVDITYVSASGTSGFQIGGGARYYSRLGSNILLIFLQALTLLYNPWGYYPYSGSYAGKDVNADKGLNGGWIGAYYDIFSIADESGFEAGFLAGHKFVLGPIFLDPFAGFRFGSINDRKFRGLRYGVNIGICF